MAESVPILGATVGWGEMILILALVLILFGAKLLPEIGRGLRLGVREFRKATREVRGGLDKDASDAGESLGGIYGKPAAEALTPDNQTAELYDPAVFGAKQGTDGAAKNAKASWWRRLWRRLCVFIFRARLNRTRRAE